MDSALTMVESNSSKDLARKKRELVAKWERVCGSGKQSVLYSFLAVSKDINKFGVLTLPEEFVDTFGHTLPFMIGISCKMVLWCVDCDIERKEICSLSRFMKYYGLKIFNLVQFDYLGEGLFVVRLFKETAIESKYPTDRANDVQCSKEWEALNRSHYVLDTSTLEGEKAIASISFNACSSRTDYVYLLYVESDVDHSRGDMILSPMWEDYYKHWEDGSLVVFKFLERSWPIEIKKRGEVCYLGKGLVEFVSGAGVRDGDFLVAFRENEDIKDCMRVCIYDHEDHGLDLVKVCNPSNCKKSTTDQGQSVDRMIMLLIGSGALKKISNQFIPHTIKPAGGVWKRTQKIKFITDKGVWDIGITNTGARPRFSAGWNKFIRGNEYTAGQKLMFRLVEHDDYIDFLISKI
ncbi:hypothetical protein ACET3Z_011004 [Daucus carota]